MTTLVRPGLFSSSEGDTLGFTVRPRDAPTYLLLSDD